VKRGDKRGGAKLLALEKFTDTVAHFAGGFIGEGYSQDIVRLNLFFRDEIRNADSDNARLARTGAGKDKDRAFGRLNGLFLRRI
jgi:hypothetical protein